MVAARQLFENYSVSQRVAALYHSMGLNVFPLDSYSKLSRGGFEWGKVGLSRWAMRLPFGSKAYKLLMECFDGACNVGIICGDVSGNCFVIDCESMPIFFQYAQAMKARNIPVFAQKTGRGAHIFLKGDKPVKSLKIQDKADATLYEIRSNGQYVVAALSYHPSGARYQWLSAEGALSVELPFLPEIPTVSIDSIDFLQDADGRAIALAPIRSKSAASKRRDQYLANGHNIPEGSREYTLFKMACDYRYNGTPKSQAEIELLPVGIASGLSSQEASHAIDKGYDYPQKADSAKGFSTIEKLSRFAACYQWRNKADKRVFEALIVRYKQDNFNYKDASFSASIRNISVLSGLTNKTVIRSLGRLRDEDKLIERRGENARTAAVYRFTKEAFRDIGTPVKQSFTKDYLTGVGMSQTVLDRDLKERGGLGDTGLRILRYLQAETRAKLGKPTSAAEIAKALQIAPKTVYRYLSEDKKNSQVPLLLHYKLVFKKGRGFVANEDRLAEQALAQAAGVLGKSQERKEKHDLERSIAIVSAMHKQIIARDKNHPKHHTTKPAASILMPDFSPSASDELEALVNSLVKVGGLDEL